MSLMKDLLNEIERNIELKRMYAEIPIGGFIGASMIDLDIQRAKKSIDDDNVVEMLTAFGKLKKNK